MNPIQNAENDATILPPNGAAAAALVAAGVASATLGLTVVLCAASPKGIAKWLSVYPPAGPLSGKSSLAVIAYLVSWFLLSVALRGRSVRFGLWAALAFALMAAGLILTFPPVYEIFAPK